MKKSRRTYNGVHLNKKSNTQDVVEQSLTLNFSLFKVLELLPTKARHECFEILKLYIKLYIV